MDPMHYLSSGSYEGQKTTGQPVPKKKGQPAQKITRQPAQKASGQGAYPSTPVKTTLSFQSFRELQNSSDFTASRNLSASSDSGLPTIRRTPTNTGTAYSSADVLTESSDLGQPMKRRTPTNSGTTYSSGNALIGQQSKADLMEEEDPLELGQFVPEDLAEGAFNSEGGKSKATGSDKVMTGPTGSYVPNEGLSEAHMRDVARMIKLASFAQLKGISADMTAVYAKEREYHIGSKKGDNNS